MKILVGISGGVDSAFVASSLKKQGHEVEGCVLIMHPHCEIEEARRVASEIDIPLHEIDVSSTFDSIVKENFINEYLSGRTPNPCIICNERVKFRALCDYAIERGFDRIATGHYADIAFENGRYAVKMAVDRKKDQSYMLYRLPQDVLSMLVLPLANSTKSNVRSSAGEESISVAEKKDSQEICFLPDGNYAEYIESVRGTCPEGNFVDPEGKILGKHKGIIRYTVGQRKGLGIALGARAFVTDISPITNDITLSCEVKGREKVDISGVVYSGISEPNEVVSLNVLVKLRYTARLTPALAHLNTDGSATLVFDSPVTAAPGQSAVAYRDGTVLFGGFIH